jgi:thiol:disulfide interchange protein
LSPGQRLEFWQMMKNTVRGILGLVLTAAATWLAGYIVDQIFGPDDETA